MLLSKYQGTHNDRSAGIIWNEHSDLPRKSFFDFLLEKGRISKTANQQHGFNFKELRFLQQPFQMVLDAINGGFEQFLHHSWTKGEVVVLQLYLAFFRIGTHGWSLFPAQLMHKTAW